MERTISLRPGSGLALTTIERSAMIYLALPLLIFFLGWFKPVVGGALAAVLIFALARTFRAWPVGDRVIVPWRHLLILAVIAALWSAFGGAGHLLFANSDWRIRDAVLRDLMLTNWPPAYAEFNAVPVILRTPLAYFLPAATFGKLADIHYADLFLYGWTALGAGFFLVLALARMENRSRLLVGAGILILFSGMDVLGMLNRHGPGAFDFSTHLEWWATRFQYSSTTTQLFWVPNHAIPGWIAAAILLRRWRSPDIVPALPILGVLMVLWSPLPFIGAAPLMLAVVLYHAWQRDLPIATFIRSTLIAAVIFLPIALFLISDMHAFPTRWTSTAAASGPQHDAGTQFEFATLYAKFVFLEFGALTFLLLRLNKEPMVRIAGIVLLVLPLYSFGPNNDLAMRASIPALAILAMVAVDCLASGNWRQRSAEKSMLALLLAIGAITAVTEFSRTVRYARRAPPAYKQSTVQVDAGFPPHYVARLSSPWLIWMLRTPAPVPQFGVVPDAKSQFQ